MWRGRFVRPRFSLTNKNFNMSQHLCHLSGINEVIWDEISHEIGV